MTDTLETLLAAAKKIEPTRAERRDQRVSFVYGNLKMSRPTITREDVVTADRKLHPEDYEDEAD